jgi:glycosyltransferase involved in cell wall biosynthesis
MLGTRGMPTTYGGVERSVEEISVRLAQRGHDVVAYCRSPYCPDRLPEYHGVRLRYLPTINTKHLEAVTHSALATFDTLVRKYDIIHFHGTGPSLFVPVARLSRAKVVATVQGLDYRRDKWGRGASSVLRLGAWSAAHFPDKTIVVSRELERHFREGYATRPVYIPNGVNLPPSNVGSPPFDLPRERYLLFLGRLVPEKSVDTLIEAYHLVDTDLPLVIAGPTSHSDGYARHLAKLAAADQRVRLVGPIYGAEKDALLAHAYAVCQPSKLEGLPIVLLEALSHGRCAVVSDLPEHLEVVGGTPAGPFAFRVGDVDALADVLQGAVSDPTRVAAAGAAGRKIVETRYGWDDVVDALEDMYAELVVSQGDQGWAPFEPRSTGRTDCFGRRTRR